MMMRNVYIGLGSNLGDRFRTINSAIADIERELVESRSIKSLTTSNIYETEALGMDDGTPPFSNCVVCVESDLKLTSCSSRGERTRPEPKQVSLPGVADPADLAGDNDSEVSAASLDELLVTNGGA